MQLDLSIPMTAPLVVFVEDPVTRDYLRALWSSPVDIQFRPAGGNEGVRALTDLFRENGYPNVFGVTDRDFGQSNIGKWNDPSKGFRTFILSVHEIENYMLDADALGASSYHNRGLATHDLEERMLQKAVCLSWWAACRGTIATLKRRFREPFVPDPNQSVVDERSARNHICESEWFKKLAQESAASTEGGVHAILAAEHATALQRVKDGTWRQEFAGKEILRDVAGWMCDRPRISNFPARDADFYSDLAKGVGRWQASNGRVPQAIQQLLSALRNRIPPVDR